ncbi:hypothetical protein I7I50_06374 [Histoplasma capsulatum G186AR]|uniref:Uncharacterized protein n=1 Tax=Ajellomyces capsulatus TaxID=5037 RepID=A0A8H7YX08_AJECA|nr:hypothetical protein I7I52_10553 [Histoplasma capsulatum]QSS67332.1 hypothetical protein I7I50_06374 [Histoplasma capsulatum G186AR]
MSSVSRSRICANVWITQGRSWDGWIHTDFRDTFRRPRECRDHWEERHILTGVTEICSPRPV